MTHALAQSTVPMLRYTPPANAFQSGTGSPDDYAFNSFNASVQIYPFRPFTGNIQQAFQMTLLRDWIALQYQEQNLAGPPQFSTYAVPDTDLVLIAQFVENGYFRLHNRMLIVVGNQAAIVDASAGTAQSWQAAAPFLAALASSLRVEAARAPAPLTAVAGRQISGLYMAITSKTMSNPFGVGIYTTSALLFYLFSADGRVYRHYDALDVPGGNIAHFDFDAAERDDPQNSGRYTVDGHKLIIRLEGQQPETIITDAPRDGVMIIKEVPYQRQ